MKILKLILIITGIALVAFGLWNVFAPTETIDAGLIASNDTVDPNNQTFGMIGLGVIALVAGAFLKNRR